MLPGFRNVFLITMFASDGRVYVMSYLMAKHVREGGLRHEGNPQVAFPWCDDFINIDLNPRALAAMRRMIQAEYVRP